MKWLAALAALFLSLSADAAGLAVTDLAIEPPAFDPATQQTNVRFRVSEPARVTLRIFDGHNLLVRTIASDRALPAGEAKLVWDGRDERGTPVPPEAYVATLTATNTKGESVEHDLTDLTGGDDIRVPDVSYDAAQGVVRYTLPDAARVNLRVGLGGGGPLLGTIVDWVPRAAGAHEERWDGKDASAVLDLAQHPQRKLYLNAFALPRNTILVLPETDRVALIADLPWGRVAREPKKPKTAKPRLHADQPIESRGDVQLRLLLPPDLERNKDGAYRITEPVPIRLELDAADKARLLNERFEAMFFVDGVFLQENELGFLPMTWRWDLLGITPGEHYFTANVIGFDGHVGAATVKVVIGEKGKGQ